MDTYQTQYRSLRQPIVVVDLGSSMGLKYNINKPIGRDILFFTVDAVQPSQSSSNSVKLVRSQELITGRIGTTEFYERYFLPASSCLKDNPQTTYDFGMDAFAAVKEVHLLQCSTLKSLLTTSDISHVDLLKTDLEGLDLEVLRSTEEFDSDPFFIECEVSFKQRYLGEPNFMEVFHYLFGRGYEIVGLTTESWRYATPRRDYVNDGTLVWGDAHFVLSPRLVPISEDHYERYVLCAWLSGYRNLADQFIEAWVRPRFKDLAEQLISSLFSELVSEPEKYAQFNYPHLCPR